MLIFIILSIIMLITIGVLLYVNFNSSLIHINKCPKIRGDFGVKANFSLRNDNGELATLSTCGSDGRSLCQNDAFNLQAAIHYCNIYPIFCNAFVYNAQTKKVTIVDDTAIEYKDSTYDLYQRQFPKIIKY